MRVFLCSKNEILVNKWSDNLKNIDANASVVHKKDVLLDLLASNDSKQSIVFLEDSFAGEDLDSLKEFTIELKKWYPNVFLFVLSQYPNFSLGRILLQLGANGYANARMNYIHFHDALETILRGDTWVYPEFVQMMIKSINSISTTKDKQDKFLEVLTPREKEVLELIKRGYSNKEIAKMADITLRTVKAHTASIYEKLKVKDRLSLILFLNS